MTKIDLGDTVVTVLDPPPDFDPATASPEMLRKMGWPARPDAKEPAKLRSWQCRFGAKPRFVVPEFARLQTPRRAHRNLATKLEASSRNWSGALVRTPAGKSVQWVTGSFFVPTFSAPADGEYVAICFVGIGGFPSTCLFQAGFAYEVAQVGGSASEKYNFWWEWFPATPGYYISNLGIGPGTYAQVTVEATSGVSGIVTVIAPPTVTQFEVRVADTPENQVATDSAEWILERGDIMRFGLPAFTPQVFAPPGGPLAGYTDGSFAGPAEGELLTIVDEAGTAMTGEAVIDTVLGDVLTIIRA